MEGILALNSPDLREIRTLKLNLPNRRPPSNCVILPNGQCYLYLSASIFGENIRNVLQKYCDNIYATLGTYNVVYSGFLHKEIFYMELLTTLAKDNQYYCPNQPVR